MRIKSWSDESGCSRGWPASGVDCDAQCPCYSVHTEPAKALACRPSDSKHYLAFVEMQPEDSVSDERSSRLSVL